MLVMRNVDVSTWCQIVSDEMAGHSASLLAQIVLHSPYCYVERVLMRDSAEDSVKNDHLRNGHCVPQAALPCLALPCVWLYYNL